MQGAHYVIAEQKVLNVHTLMHALYLVNASHYYYGHYHMPESHRNVHCLAHFQLLFLITHLYHTFHSFCPHASMVTMDTRDTMHAHNQWEILCLWHMRNIYALTMHL